MTLALLLSDIPRSFSDWKHFMHTFPLVTSAMPWSMRMQAAPAGTMPAQRAAGRRTAEQTLASEAVWAFFLFQKGKIQEPHSLATCSSRM